jgi:hypothetical protein
MRFLRALPLLLLPTCVDYRLVGPAPPGEAELHLVVDVLHADTLTLALYGYFTSGAGASGAVRTLADSTMLLQDQITLPEVIGASQLRYAWEARFQDAFIAPDSARARGPIIETDAPPPMMSVPVMRRLQPPRLQHPIGSDLILELSSIAVPEPLTRIYGQWFLEIEDGTRRILNLGSNGLPPSQLRLEWAWLEQSLVPGDSLSATLVVQDGYEVADSPYLTNVSRQTQLVWTISIVQASDESAP